MILETSHLKNEETGLSISNKMGKYLFVAGFPGPYALGMANLGYQSVIKAVYDTPNWRIERFFSDTGIRTIERKHRLNDADIIGFTVGYEIEIFSLIHLLQSTGIPVFSHERSGNQPNVMIGGPLAGLNPEILAPFADIIFVGESEEVLPNLLAAWEESCALGLTRREILVYLSRFPGVYIPQFYYPRYRSSMLVGFERESFVPETVQRQWVDINGFETRTQIYSPRSYFKNMGLMEISRGCQYRCRFCAGNVLYRPLRQRSLGSVIAMIDRLRGFTSHLGIVGADVLSHPEWKEIMDYVIHKSLTMNFSSLSAVTLSRHMDYLPYLVDLGVRTVTLAPESGDQLAREYFGKALDDEKWIHLTQQIVDLGIPKIKFYFMLGKTTNPAEKDLDFLDELCRKTASHDRLMVSYSFLVPKPHTQFEATEALSLSEWKKEKEVFEKGLKKMKIRFSGESLRVAWVELLLARGDRQIAQALPSLINRGNGLVFEHWQSVLQGLGRDVEQWPRLPWKNSVFPWSIIDNGKGKTYCKTGKGLG